ncbi:hypothetical protein GE09DRAFT_1055473 [Coniochaeta sp. 2T2.1]|nr:hypothetical protein GE09DRAFT_1055473 [Coniochaeta sp. 2T2.1]
MHRCTNDFADSFPDRFRRPMEDSSARPAVRSTDRQPRLLASSSPSSITPDFASPRPRSIFGRMADNSDPSPTPHPAPIATNRADREGVAERGISHFEALDGSDSDDSETPGRDIDDSDTPYDSDSDSESDSHAAGSRPSHNYKTDNHIYTPAYRDFISHMRRGNPSEYARMTEGLRIPNPNPRPSPQHHRHHHHHPPPNPAHLCRPGLRLRPRHPLLHHGGTSTPPSRSNEALTPSEQRVAVHHPRSGKQNQIL